VLEWPRIETLLLAAAKQALDDFARAHTSETFYGAIVMIEPYDGASFEILLNTEAHLRQEAGAANAREIHYRFLPGGFEHTLHVSKAVSGWDAIASEIEAAMEADMEDDRLIDGLYVTAQKFLDTACRIAARLELTAFAQLFRVPDFKIAVTPDPREPGDFALERYARFKQRAALAAPSGR